MSGLDCPPFALGETEDLQHRNMTHGKVEEWFPVRLLQIFVFVYLLDGWLTRGRKIPSVSGGQSIFPLAGPGRANGSPSPQATWMITTKTRWQKDLVFFYRVYRSEQPLKITKAPNLASWSEFNKTLFYLLRLLVCMQ